MKNFYGLDIPTKKELLSYQKNITDLEHSLQIEKLIYQSINDLRKSIQYFNPSLTDFESSIFDGNYI